jgi:regulator of sigma E protease
MELLHVLVDYGLPFILILTLVVFVHELGHFLVARRNGVRVDVFSIGFGPELFGWNDRRGTRWRISAVPLGGYVKMFGDTDAASTGSVEPSQLTEAEKAVAFPHKTVAQRAAVVVAGPAANFIFAILLIAGLFLTYGEGQSSPPPARVDSVAADSAAAEAGFQVGDVILSIDGKPVALFEELKQAIVNSTGALSFTVKRGEQTVELTATPKVQTIADKAGSRAQRMLGIGSPQPDVHYVRTDPASAVWHAFTWVGTRSYAILGTFGEIVSGARSAHDLGGVLAIADVSGQVARAGVVDTIVFVALLSINLGVINLFPIPVLDGGHLMFYAAEALRGRPLGRRAQEYGSMMGLVAVVALMIFVNWNDFARHGVVKFFASLIS